MGELNELVRTWWPVVLFVGAGAVWALRLEGRVNVLDRSLLAIVQSEKDWREAHAREIAPEVRRITDTMQRIEDGLGSVEHSLGNVRERLAGVERAMNGHMKPWDGYTERRQT